MPFTAAAPLYLRDFRERLNSAEHCAIEMTGSLRYARQVMQGPVPDREAARRECAGAIDDYLLPLVCYWLDICPCFTPEGLEPVQIFREYRRLSLQNDGVAEEDREWEGALVVLAAHMVVAETRLRGGRLDDANVVLYRFQRSAAYRLLWGDDVEWDTVVPPPPHVDPATDADELLRALQL